MAIEDVCAMSVGEAEEELERLGRMVLFGDEFVSSYTNTAELTKTEGHILHGLFELDGLYRKCWQLADYLHEESSSWNLWKCIKREYSHVVRQWS